MNESAKIKKVYTDDLSRDGKTDISLDIHFNNRFGLMLNLNEKENDPLFGGIVKGLYTGNPETDGSRFYWQNGPSVTVDELTETLLRDSGGIIADVEANGAEPDEIYVTLAGGHMITLPTPPEYKNAGDLYADGGRVFWENGRSLSLDEIISSLRDGGETGGRGPAVLSGVSLRNPGIRRFAVPFAACAAVAAVAILAITGSFRNDVIFEEEPVPLGEAPNGVIVYPEISDVAAAAGNPELTLELTNPPDNPCFLVFEIVLADTQEIIYASGPVAPGENAGPVAPARPLEKGEYRAVLNIAALDPDGLGETEKKSAEFILTVN